jgi:hypothetical protein
MRAKGTMSSNMLKQVEAFRQSNLDAARRILADPSYEPGSLMATWAEMVLRGGINVRAELERRAGVGRMDTTTQQ